MRAYIHTYILYICTYVCAYMQNIIKGASNNMSTQEYNYVHQNTQMHMVVTYVCAYTLVRVSQRFTSVYDYCSH